MARSRRLLLLGGTTEASALARRLDGRPDLTVVTSLAGRTSHPVLPPGEIRIGGFGGKAALVAYLRAERIDLVVDATHPFAAVMPWNAASACRVAGVPRLCVRRPPWTARPGERWTHAATLTEAGRRVGAGSARRVMVTTGRGGLEAFEPAVGGGRWWLVRCIEPPDPLVLHPAEVVLDRGPFSLAGELDLLRRARIDLLVTKNSGGAATVAKLDAARTLGVRVLVVDRPPSPSGPTAATVADAVAWVTQALG